MEIEIETPSNSKKLGDVLSQGMKIKPKRRSVSLSLKRKKPSFKLPTLVDDPIMDQEIKESYKRAFFVKGMQY